MLLHKWKLHGVLYLPIQLDATCNGFKYMILLNNQTILFNY